MSVMEMVQLNAADGRVHQQDYDLSDMMEKLLC